MSFRNALIFCSLLLLPLVACQANDNESSQSNEDNVNYHLTEENEHPEINLPNQPVSSYWFPEDLLEWDYEEDEDFPFNISTVPLAERGDDSKLKPVNDKQYTDIVLSALTIMNSNTRGNPQYEINTFDSNTFSYWQYDGRFNSWGGSAGEGSIVPPSPDLANVAHKNGVPVL